MHGMYTHEKHKNNAIALLPRRGLFNYNGSSDYCQMHLVTLVARMRFVRHEERVNWIPSNDVYLLETPCIHSDTVPRVQIVD